MRKFLILTCNFFFLLVVFNSCTAPAVINFQPKDNQANVETRYVDGNKLATSKQGKSALSIVSIKKHEYGQGAMTKVKYLVIDLVLNNMSNENANFLPENVKVMAFNSENKMKALKTYRPDEFLAKIQRIQNWNNVGYAMSAAVDNSKAGKTTSTTNTTSNTNISGTSRTTGSFSTNVGLYGSGQSRTNLTGNINSNETSSTTTVDHGAKIKAQRESERELRAIREMQKSTNQELESMLLKANTLSPGQVIGGKIIVEYSSTHNQALYLTVPFSSDTHEVEYSLLK